MLKHLDNLESNDYVLLQDTNSPLGLSSPWRVLKIIGARVYLEDPAKPKRYIARTSVKLVLSDEASARAVFNFETANSSEYLMRAQALEHEHRNKLEAFLQTLPASAATVKDRAQAAHA